MTRPPNTRMQRTRSSPSALRSPLMRCPLGRRITMMALSLLLGPVFGGSLMFGQASREAKPQFKGMELYSWQEGAAWRFSLVPGTNRSKSVAEVKSPKVTISSLAKLKDKLSRLAPGEQVFWFNPDASPFVYPTPDVACELVAFCDRLKIKLQLGKPCAAA